MPCQVIQKVDQNAYVIDLLLDFSISSTFNIEDLIAYNKTNLIANDPFRLTPNPTPDDPFKM